MHLKSRCIFALLSLFVLPAAAQAQISRIGEVFLATQAPVRGSAVAFDSQNNVYFAVSSHGAIYGRFLHPDGSPLGEPIPLQQAPGFAQFPHVAYSPDAGAFLVTWHNGGVRGRMVSYTAGLISSDVALSPWDTVYEVVGAPVAYSTASREFLVVWRSGVSFNIEGIRVGNHGLPLAGAFAISPTSEVVRNSPSLAYNPSLDEFLVVYRSGYPTSSAVARRVQAGSGALVGGELLLGVARDIYTTGVAYIAAAGRYIAAWHQLPGDVIDSRVLNGDGTPLGSVTTVSTRFGTYDSLSLSANPVSATVLLAGQDKLSVENGGTELNSGGVPGQPTMFTAAGGTGNFHPRVAAHTGRREWMLVTANSFSRTLAQRLQTSSAGQGPPPASTPRVTSFGANMTFPVSAGTAISWTATASGGSGTMLYRFLRYTDGVGWSIAQDYSTNNTHAWAPSQGQHALQVWVKSSNSANEYDDWRGSGSFAVTAPIARVSSLTASQASPVPYNTPVTWTAQAQAGGLPVEYQFWRYTAGGGWAVAQNYSASNQFTWVPPPGTNHVQVWVRTVGSGVTYQHWFGNTITVAPPGGSPARLSGISANTGFPASPASQIIWTASATGGSGSLEYRFWLYDGTTGAWSVLRDWSTSNQVAWVPGIGNTGSHMVQVWVRSVGSSQAYEHWMNTQVFNITAITNVSLVSNVPMSTVRAGQTVTFTAAVSGGSGPWDFRWFSHDGTGWTERQPYIANGNTLTWTIPAGTRALQVWVRSAGSGTQYEAWTGIAIGQ